MLKKTLLALSIAVLAGGCGDTTGSNSGNSGQGSSSVTQVSTSDKLQQLYTDYFNEQFELDPLLATYIGEDGYNGKLPNFLSPEHLQKKRQFEQKYLDKINSIDATTLTDSARISYNIFKGDREMALRGMQFPSELIPINQFYNLANQFAMLGSGTSAQPFSSYQDFKDWASRMEQIPALFEQARKNMRKGVERDIVQPRVLIEKAIPQIEAHIVEDVEESIFWRPIDDLPENLSAQEEQQITERYREIISQQVIPAYQQLRDYLADDYLPHTRTDSFGIGQLPGGKAWYHYQIEAHTSTSLTASDVHSLGKSEVHRIHNKMREIMEQVNFEGDLQEFFDFMTNDPKFIYDSRDAMIEDYKSLRSKVDKRLPELFNIFPEADYEVRQVEEFREQSASSGSYQPAPTDNSKPAVFYLNTYDLASRPTWAKTALFLHEAAPGHHFQISIQQQLNDLPKFRKFGRETAYTEGWGLYAESLGKELGLYDDPYQHFGALAAELWRSIRLVVDTGIHSKGWSRQQVLDYMYQNAPVAEARAVSEAERFMALPGQALAYKIGQLKIDELRREAKRKLGDKFDIKAFHRVVLEDGAVPLIVLQQKVKRWIIDLRV
ncbi:MAG: DUF885 domain-containing protein [Pseudomonadota bacterium]